MRAIVMQRYGGPEVLELVDRPAAAPGPGEALVRVAAVAVNRLDIWVRQDVGHAPHLARRTANRISSRVRVRA